MMKHLTSLVAGAAFVMAAAGLALAVRNYLEEEEEWELFDDCAPEESEEDCCCAPETPEEAPAEEAPAED